MLAIRCVCRCHVVVGLRFRPRCISTIQLQNNRRLISHVLQSSRNEIIRYGHHGSPFLSQVDLKIVAPGLPRSSVANTTFLTKRHKSKSARKKEDNDNDRTTSDSDDNDSDDDDDDDDGDDLKPKRNDREKPFPDVDFPGDANLPSNYKKLKGNLTQPRYDSVCRFGFRISSKKFLDALYDQRCKLNGLPLKQKRTIVKNGDTLDIMVDTDEMKRIRVVSLDHSSPKYTVVFLKVWKTPFSKSSVKDLE